MITPAKFDKDKMRRRQETKAAKETLKIVNTRLRMGETTVETCYSHLNRPYYRLYIESALAAFGWGVSWGESRTIYHCEKASFELRQLSY